MTMQRRLLMVSLLALVFSVLAACNQAGPTTDTTASTPAALNPAPAKGTTAPAAPASGKTTASGAATPGAAGGQPSTATKGKGDGTTAAVVNGEGIAMADFQRQAAQARNFLLNDKKVNVNTPEGDQALKTVYNQVLEELISEALIRQYAQKNNITVGDDELAKSIEALVKDMGGQQEYDKALAARGLTKDLFATEQRSQLLGNKVRDLVTKDVPQSVEQVHARHILVQTLDEAIRAAKRVEGGEDFAKVAREVSKDPGTAKAGGDLGWFPRGLMVPEFEQAAFSLPLKQVSSPVQTQFGYHVIQVLEKDPNRKLPDDRWQELRQAKFQEWLESQRDAAKIERYVE